VSKPDKHVFLNGGGLALRRNATGEYRGEFRSALTGTHTVTQFFASGHSVIVVIEVLRAQVLTFLERLQKDFREFPPS
jgi:hypothetical protein